jgi:hypothetical protein
MWKEVFVEYFNVSRTSNLRISLDMKEVRVIIINSLLLDRDLSRPLL